MSLPTAGLARRWLATGALWTFAVGASSPMTVVVGAVVAVYATTGVLGLPVAFVILGVVLALLSVGYVAMSRHVPHSGTAYALLSHGLGRATGVAGAAVAVVAYNGIQISLYGLLGATLAGTGLGGSWWLWALVAWLLVAVLGVRQVRVSARVLAVFLVAELILLSLLDVAALLHPAGGHLSLAALHPTNLWQTGVGGVFALGTASFIGYEFPPVFGEEARSHQAVARSVFYALGFLALFYALSSWAVAVAVGPGDEVVAASRTPSPAGLPLDLVGRYYGATAGTFGLVLLITSMFGAMLAFHSAVARYLFALGREHLVWSRFAASRHGAPVGGSVAQSLTALAVIAAFAYLGANPITTMFTWLSTVGAVGVLALLIACAAASMRYFRTGGHAESAWTRRLAPALGLLSGLVVLAQMVANQASLLGVPAGSPLTYIIPGVVVAAALGGYIWAAIIHTTRPDVYDKIGRGRPHHLAVRDPRLDELAA